jgi:hypothetical protein
LRKGEPTAGALSGAAHTSAPAGETFTSVVAGAVKYTAPSTLAAIATVAEKLTPAGSV